MKVGEELLKEALSKIKQNYLTYQFMVHRDVAWVFQKVCYQLIEEKGYLLDVYQDYPLKKGRKEANDNELFFILQGMNYKEMFKPTSSVELVVRILFEPSKHRRDICEYHLPRLNSSKINDHLSELKSLVESKKAKEAILIIFDEYSRHQALLHETKDLFCEEWGTFDDPGLNVSILMAHYHDLSLLDLNNSCLHETTSS